MNFDPKAIRRALMIAKDLAVKIDPGFAVHNLPMPPQGVPLERNQGGPIKTIEGADRERNLAEFMRGVHPLVPPVLYTGTTGDFSQFDRSRANIESDLGAGFYASNTKEDVSQNYAGEGPDLTNRLERTAEDLGNIYDEEIPHEELMQHARERLGVTHKGMMMPIHMALKNPVVLGGKHETFYDLHHPYDEKNDEYGEPHGKLIQLHDAFKRAASEFEVPEDDIHQTVGKLMERGVDYGGLKASEVESIIKNELANHQDPNTGDLASSEILRKTFEHMGHDGIIDTTVNRKFGTEKRGFANARIRGMAGVNPKTIHYIAFHPNQIKSALGNRGTFDRREDDITKAEGGEVEAAGMGINVRSDKKAGIRYADEIVDGNKKYETRDSDSLRPYVGKRVAIVRTGEGPAKAIGEVTVGEPIVADQAMFHKMRPHHLVPVGSAFDIKPGSQKYLYPMHDPERFDAEKDVGAGIIARKVMSKAEGGAVDDLLPPRNLNPMGMYSAAAEAARAIPQERGTPQQMLATMKGVKPDELRWSGVQNKFAGQKTVTRDELARHFESQMPPLQETDQQKFEGYMVPGGSNYRAKLLMLPPDLSSQVYGTDFGNFKNPIHWDEPNVVTHLLLKDREYSPAKRVPKPDSTVNISMRGKDGEESAKKVDAWKTLTPGLFITKSEEPGDKGSYIITHEGTGLNATAGNSYPFHKAMDAARRLGELYDGWLQDADIVKNWAKNNASRAREVLSQAVNPFAKKALHLDELQSDWGQQGRDRGFTTADKIAAITSNVDRLRNQPGEFVNEWRKAESELENEKKKKIEAPYVTSTNQWTDLGLKRALVEAARGGYDKLIWTPGEVQADKYKLNRFIDALRYKKFDDGYYHVSAEKNGRTIHAEKYKPEELPGFVGQEMAKKIVAGEGEPTREAEDSEKVIKGLDLNVGGRGMYEYYDKILPRRLLALAQEHDPQVTIEPHKEAKDKTKNFPSLRITPRMRESILKRGFKAFKRGGAVQGHLFHHHDEPTSIKVPVMDREKAVRRALMIAKR